MTAPRNKYLWLEGLWLLDLSGERLRVLGAIQSAHRDGASLISTAEIVRRTGLSRSAASRNLKAAERQKLVAVEWSKGGSRPHRITLLDPGMAVLNCGSHSAAVGGDADCGSHEAAVTAAPSRARVVSTFTLAGAPPAGAPQPQAVSTFEVVDQGSASSPPLAPEGAVGDDAAPADAMRKPSSVTPSASNLEERIAHLESLFDDYRDPATGELQPDMPAIVREFYMRDEDPTLYDLAAIASAFSQWKSGDWVEPATDEEMLAEHLRRHAVFGRDQREDDESTWDQAEPDEDDDANPLIAAAPTRR